MERIVARRQCPKILVSGTHSTGKTTLIAELEKVLRPSRLRVISEIARECPFVLNLEQNELSTAWLIAAQVKAEIEAQTHADFALVLCDRSMPDIFAYHSVASSKRIGAIATFASEWMSTYDHVFLSEPDLTMDMSADKLRVPSVAYRAEIQQAIRGWLTAVGAEYDTLPHGLDRQLPYVIGRLQEKGWLS
ncbi:ATP-binding protein [Saccharothrix sp. NPDC042600]|uniref:ATP/GTP-binding protein n=1 Tax=Saccharothrix TaxID=2071 RepID=UPI0033D99489|nr:hypothetical protein GCM10017745_35520 [Saccharothrix mutabilis subsp. capreolus]